MIEDPLLDALTNAAREADPTRDPRWEALALGTLSKEDEAELAKLAETSDDHRALYEMFRPLDADVRARIAGQIVKDVAASVREEAASGEPSRAPKATSVASKPAAIRPRRMSSFVYSGLALAAAIALFIAFGQPSAPLPAYAIAIAGGEQSDRSSSDAPKGARTIGPGSRLAVTLRPATPASGTVEAVGFLVREGEVRPWPAPFAIAAGGAVHVEGDRETLFAGVPAGAWEMVVVVGKPGALPAREKIAEMMRDPSGAKDAGIQILRATVILRDAGGAP